MGQKIKITAELVYEPNRARFPGKTIEEIAEQEMDHAPDLLGESEDTVYRFEVVDESGAGADSSTGSAREVIARLEQLLAELKAQYGG